MKDRKEYSEEAESNYQLYHRERSIIDPYENKPMLMCVLIDPFPWLILINHPLAMLDNIYRNMTSFWFRRNWKACKSSAIFPSNLYFILFSWNAVIRLISYYAVLVQSEIIFRNAHSSIWAESVCFRANSVSNIYRQTIKLLMTHSNA